MRLAACARQTNRQKTFFIDAAPVGYPQTGKAQIAGVLTRPSLHEGLRRCWQIYITTHRGRVRDFSPDASLFLRDQLRRSFLQPTRAPKLQRSFCIHRIECKPRAEAPHIPVAGCAAGSPMDVGERPQRRHPPRGARLRADINVRFSNRPFRVKRFQTIHHYSVDVAHGLVLLYGIGTRGLPSCCFVEHDPQPLISAA